MLLGNVSYRSGKKFNWDAKAFTTSDGFALDVFSVQDPEGEAFDDKERLNRLRQSIEKTLRGQAWPRTALAGGVAGNARIGDEGAHGPRCRFT